MGRPKGSKNKPREEWREAALDETLAMASSLKGTHVAALADEIIAARAAPAPPVFLTVPLTDEDLEPVRRAKANHDRAAAKYRKDEIASELRRKEIGEIEELSVPQVVGFDLPAAMRKAAEQKARTVGCRFAHNLRKTPEGWVFEASNSQKVPHVPTPDQP